MSLKARWLASMLGVVLAGTAITTFVSSRITYYGASRGAYEWLAGVHRNFVGSFHEQLFKRLEVQALLLTRIPALVDTVSARRVAEVPRQFEALGTLQASDVWALVGEDGTVLATNNPSCHLEQVRGQPGSTAALTRRMIMCGRVPVFSVTAAVKAGERFQAWLVLGTPVDEAYADAYFTAAGLEVVLIDRQGVLASTFRNTEGARIGPDLRAISTEALWAEPSHFGEYRLAVPSYRGYRGTTQPLAVGASALSVYLYSVPLLPDQLEVPVRAVLFVPTEVLDIGAFYSTLIMIFFGLLLLPLLGVVVWRLVNGFVRPIAVLGKMTARVAEGDLECEVTVVRQDELGQLTRDFNDMVHKLRETQRQLTHSEKMAAIGQLAAGVGHEINNPLAYISANLSFATETLTELSGEGEGASARPLPPQVAGTLQEICQALDEAQDGARRVSRIVQELRSFARYDEREERQVLAIQPIVETALKIVANTLRYRARLTLDFRETLPVKVNEMQLVQVFVNLLINAAQAIPEGHAEQNEVRISTAMGADGSTVVEVRDTGTGMSPEVLRRLFEPFFTTKPVGQGTGLGLSTSRNIIEGFRGSLTVQSELGKGSAFRITLPGVRPERMAGPPAFVPQGTGGREEPSEPARAQEER